MCIWRTCASASPQCCTISRLGSLLLTFSVPLQVAYPGDNVSVPLGITNAALPVPSFISYTITPLAGDVSFLPRSRLSGSIRWDTGRGGEAQIHLPVDWREVPQWAEYRFAVNLKPMWLAAVKQTVNDTAVHLFGVANGQCPPGTIKYACSERDVAPTLSSLECLCDGA